MTQTRLVNGINLHYRLEGEAHLPLLVLANSLGTDMRVWEPVLPYLSGYFRFLRYDKRGHGLSDCPPGPYRLEDHIDDLQGLLDALDLRKATLCGVSVGGMIAQGLAARQSDEIDGLILCNTACKAGERQSWDQRIEAITRYGLEAMSEAILERWFAPAFRQQPQALALWRNMLSGTRQQGYVATCASIRDADLSASSATLRLPALCVAGQQDKAITPDQVRQLAECIPGAQLHILPDTGHLPCVEQPKALAELIIAFHNAHLAPQSRFAQGMKTRRAVLGQRHVDQANGNKTAFDEPFQAYITETAWGAVWSRPGLTKRDRSLLTIALMASQGHKDELMMHIRATRNTGATQQEVQETLLHTAVYAGVPVANVAFKLAKEVYREIDYQPEQRL